MKEKKLFGIIYKGQTKHGSKVYIGQTIQSLEIRKAQHTKLNKILTNWEIIDTAYSREELDNKEKQWIDHYDSMNPKKGFNRQYGKGRWSNQAVIDKKIKYNSNKEWFKDLTSEALDYFYSIDIDEINSNFEKYFEKRDLTDVQLCIFKFIINIIVNNKKPDKKYKISSKTILISFIEIIKELSYLKDYPGIEYQFYHLVFSSELFECNIKESITTTMEDENDWIYNAYALTIEPGIIKKYKRVYEIDSEYDIEDSINDGLYE